MRPTTYSALILLTIILTGMTACTTLPRFSKTDISGTCENSLYPIKQGASWTYASTGGPGGSFTYTDTITEIRRDGFILSSQLEGMLHTQQWRCLADGLQALQIGGASAAGISTQGLTAEFEALEVTGISLPRKIADGSKWNYALTMQGTMATPDQQQSQSSGSYSVTMQQLGKETITVPAGTFEAVKIQANSNVDVTASFAGIPIPVRYNGVSIIWYAPNIGYIKSVENGDFSGTAFSVTTELQSYNIPQ